MHEKARNPLGSRSFRAFFERGAGESRTHDGGFAIRCLSLLATAPDEILR